MDKKLSVLLFVFLFAGCLWFQQKPEVAQKTEVAKDATVQEVVRTSGKGIEVETRTESKILKNCGYLSPEWLYDFQNNTGVEPREAVMCDVPGGTVRIVEFESTEQAKSAMEQTIKQDTWLPYARSDFYMMVWDEPAKKPQIIAGHSKENAFFFVFPLVMDENENTVSAVVDAG